MTDEFNNNLNPLAGAIGSENLDLTSISAKNQIFSEEKGILFPLDRVEISREAQEMSIHVDLESKAISEELANYLDMLNRMPKVDASELEFLKNHPLGNDKSFNKKV